MKEIVLLQPSKIVFGTGCTEKFCSDYQQLGLKRLFILTAPVIRPLLAEMEQTLQAQGVSIAYYDDIRQEP